MSALLSATGHDDSRFYSEAKRFYIILAAGMVLVALSIGAYYLFIATDPAVRVCPLYRIFGVPCPSCGGSRAFTALFKGDFHTSWILNPNAILTTMFACSVTVIMIHDIASLTFRRLPKRLLLWSIYLHARCPKSWKPSYKALITILICSLCCFEAAIWWHNIVRHI